jgi:hypothetical protein
MGLFAYLQRYPQAAEVFNEAMTYLLNKLG